MDSRRNFIGKVATGLAGTLAAPGRVLGAGERIRIGLVGPGDRGMQLARQATACSNTEVVAFADVYTRRLEAAQQAFPGTRTYLDHRYILDDAAIDAVIIATPQHLHCEHFVAALDSGKHVYQEKTMAFTVEHAKKMRAAYQRSNGLTVEIGHQHCSSGEMADALQFHSRNLTGKITAVHSHMYRNTPHGKPQWARPVYPDMTPENILWRPFLGEAPDRPFDANRYVNWRFFWDYSGGNFYENMCHQLAFWYKVLDLQIPESVTATGGLYLWKDGREVPDTMNVSMAHSAELLFSWNSGFGNNHLGSEEFVLGTDGTLYRGSKMRYFPQKVNRADGNELVGQTKSDPNGHMQDFLDCIRSGREPACPFELGFRVSIACRMAVDSYRQNRTLRWDPEKDEIV